MNKEEFLEKVEASYDKVIAIVESKDQEKIIGKVVMLTQGAKNDDMDAALELMVLGILIKENG